MRAIRITQSNWLNDQVGGDVNTVKVIEDAMAREAVEVWGIAAYAPEHDPVQFVGTGKAAERLEQLKATVTDFGPTPAEASATQELVDVTEELGLYDEPQDFGQPREYIEEDIARNRPEEPVELPRQVDNKAAWVRWAVHGDHGKPPITEEQANDLPKLQLQHRYGRRL